LMLRDNRSLVNQRILSGSVDYRLPFFKALRINLTLAADRSGGSGRTVIPQNAGSAVTNIDPALRGSFDVYSSLRKNLLLENYANYKETFGRHTFDVMAGYSWQQFRDENYTFKASSTGQTITGKAVLESGGSEYFLISQYARMNYDYNSRILVTGSVRRDGTSRFGKTNRWGLFPAGAVAFKLRDNKNTILPFAKLRLSVGVTGQQELGSRYPHLAVYQSSILGASYQFGNQFVQTIRPNGYNANLQWEETTTYNAGLDFTIVRDRITGSFDAYRRDTRGLQVYVGLAALSNLTNFGDVNVGTMETKGAELSLNFELINNKKIGWSLAVNGATNSYTITKLNERPDSTYAGIRVGGIAGGVGSNIQVHTVGYSPYSFYVYEQKYDADGKLLEGQYLDQNGDDIVNADDFYRLRNPAPKYSFGITNSLRVHNFTFSFAGHANLGNYNFDNVRSDIGYLERVYNTNDFLGNTHQSALDLNIRKQSSLTFSDHWVKNASFFRMDHITLAYQIPAKRIAQNLTISATVQNVFVVTNYDGLDPEIFRGIDNNFYPRPRTYVLGVQADF
jgi:TonB-dependent starch-binding outer membrane protein SusC